MKDELKLNVKSSYLLKLDQLTDLEIYQKAKAQGKIIIVSKDADLDQIIGLHGAPPQLINLKIANCDNKILFSFLKNNLNKAIRLLTDFNQDIIEITL